MPLVINKKSEGEASTVSPHLAITHNELQNGSANKRNVSLLMKSDVELTDESKALLKSLLGEGDATPIVVEKASYNALRRKLEVAIKQFSVDRWDWSYVEDFDESNVVFSNNDGVYYTGYTLSDEVVVLDDVATPANRVISYEASTGKLLMSDSVKGTTEGVYGLIVKSFDSISNNEKIKAIFKSKHEDEVKNVEIEIQKAVEAKQVELTKALVDLQKAQDTITELTGANAELSSKLEAIEKAAVDAKAAQRLELVKSVVKDEDQAVALHKSLEALDDTAFDTVLKSLKAKDEVIDNSDLFIQKSTTVETGEQDSQLNQLLKAQYAKKA